MKEMYLVTGAAGHLGSAVVRRLLEERRDIRALVLPGDKTADHLPRDVGRVAADLLDKGALAHFFDVPPGTEVVVVHCAGIVSTASKFSQAVHDVNVTGTKNIVDMCRERHVRKLVHVSSVHAIPTLPAGQVIREVKAFDPDEVVGPYAKTKAEATSYVQEAVNKGLDASIVFPSGICGPYDYGRSHVTQVIVDFCRGRMPIGIHGGFDFVDVRDVANGIVACGERGIAGEGYILSNRYVSVPELLKLLHDITGRKPTRIYVPLWLAKSIVPFCGLYYRIRRQTPVFNFYSLHTLSSNSAFSHDKAVRELGYNVRPFDVTLHDTVEWLKTEKRL